jgi:hypothetical protein
MILYNSLLDLFWFFGNTCEKRKRFLVFRKGITPRIVLYFDKKTPKAFVVHVTSKAFLIIDPPKSIRVGEYQPSFAWPRQSWQVGSGQYTCAHQRLNPSISQPFYTIRTY